MRQVDGAALLLFLDVVEWAASFTSGLLTRRVPAVAIGFAKDAWDVSFGKGLEGWNGSGENTDVGFNDGPVHCLGDGPSWVGRCEHGGDECYANY